MTAYIQSTENAFEERIGAHGLGQRAFEDLLARADDALDLLRKQYSDGSLPLLRYGEKSDDISEIKTAAAALAHGATDIVVLGTGGSSLGGQTLAQLASYHVPGVGQERGPKLHFMDNLDSETFARLLQEFPLATSRFVPISKSGGTAETLMQTIAALSAVKQAGLEQRIPELFLGISEPARDGKRNGLRSLLAQHRIRMLEHDTGVGGRFSVLTNVGLLPAAVLGLDIEAVRRGAHDTLAPILSNKPANEIAPAIGAALSIGLAEQRGKSISVIMAYSDRLERLTRWYVQLWAESLGKDGKGTTPLAALGPVDQHSQLQLFIAGPRDKVFTVLTTGKAKAGPPLDRDLAALAGEPDLGGRRIGDLVAAQGRATADTLAKNGCAVRTIHIEQINERSIGALLMHFMLETIIAAHLLGVDAFDQPAVEEGKILAKQYLKAGQT